MRTEILKCPVCGGSLMHSADGKSLICINKHCFDIARKGYVNLLMRAGGRHGDDKTMLEARRDFLSRGHYLPIAEAAADCLIWAAERAIIRSICVWRTGRYMPLMFPAGPVQ